MPRDFQRSPYKKQPARRSPARQPMAHIYSLAGLLTLALALAAPAFAHAADPDIHTLPTGQPHALTGTNSPTAKPSRFTKPVHVLKFVNDYRTDKQPQHVAEAVQAMVRLGLIADPEKSGIYVGFLAGVISENQTDADQLIESLFPLPPREQVILIKAIAFSGLPEWKDILSRFAERMPARKVLIKKYLYGDGKTLDQLSPSDGPFVLDALWGNYFATGSWAPAQRIIGSLELFQDDNDIEQRTIGAMVKWTLATNASRDKNLLDLTKSEMNHQPSAIRRDLREVIEAAELVETGRLRTQALAAIDDLRTKGPKRVRDWNTWGTAGTTVLALGCVAAAALGQAQLGIPCVVGGALSTAAVKYLGPTQ